MFIFKNRLVVLQKKNDIHKAFSTYPKLLHVLSLEAIELCNEVPLDIGAHLQMKATLSWS